MSRARELQESAWDAESRNDFDAVLEHFQPDATFKSSGKELKRGHAEIRAMTEEFCRDYHGLKVEILSEYGDGETSAAIEFRATVTDSNGTPMVIHAVNLVELEDGKFKTVRAYEEPPTPVGVTSPDDAG